MVHVIRPATAADVPAVLDLIHGLADYEHLSDHVEATEDQLRQALFPTDGQAPAAHCIVADVEGTSAGFALYFFSFSTFLGRQGLYLEDLFVRPEFRGAGLGKALMRHVVTIARDRGCGRMEWSVLDWNQPAIDFYESLGATRMTQWQLCRLTAADLSRQT